MPKIITPPSLRRKEKGREPVKDYNKINLEDGVDVNKAKLDFWIAKSVGTHLTSCYPGMKWGVHVDSETGVIRVFCTTLNQERSYVIHLENKNMRELQDEAYRGASEILERHYLPRSKGLVRRFGDIEERDLRRNAVRVDHD